MQQFSKQARLIKNVKNGEASKIGTNIIDNAGDKSGKSKVR